MRGVIRSALFGLLLVLPLAADEAVRQEVPAAHQAAYLGKRPSQFLIDPQGVLGRDDFRDQLKFLNYHSSDSAIDLYVMVYASGQAVADGMAAQEAVSQWFSSGKPSVVLHYVMSEPQQARLFLCPALAKVVTPAEQARALETALEQADEDLAPAKQLEKFLIQLSIRLYWMERQLQQTPEELAAGQAKSAEEAPAMPKSRREQLMEQARPYVAPAGGGLALLILLVLIRMRILSRAQYRFSDLEVEPRLGGAHAAGIGAVVSFAHPSLPPSAQKGS